MKNSRKEPSIGVSLADADLLGYSKNGKNLTIMIKLWDGRTVKFVFTEILAFVDNGGNFIMDFCKNESGSDFFNQIIKKTYDEVPLKIPYKLFQFLDIDDEPYLEIICEKFEWNIC